MTKLEEFLHECDLDEKQERIAKFLNSEEGLYIPSRLLSSNEYLLFGKFDPIHKDEFGNKLFALIRAGKKLPFEKPKKLHATIIKASHEDLMTMLSKIQPNFHKRFSMRRLAFYLINMRLSEAGISPNWRKMNRPKFVIHRDWTDGELRYMRDMQVFDMEWVHRHYPNHHVNKTYQGLIDNLQTGKYFDFGLAYIIAAAEIRSEKKAKLFKLTKDMMKEMTIIRNKDFDKKHQKLNQQLEEVEADLLLAARRNPRRGKKLLRVLNEKLNLWLSVMMTEGESETVMIENYRKLTGKEINRSTFRSKFKSLNAALREVGSMHSF